MKKRLFTLLLLFLIYGNSFTQGVSITEHDGVATLMNNYIYKSKAEPYLDGWRIQIITTNDRRRMEQVRSKFRWMYPNINLSWEHVSPYYLVKIGAYQDKMELQSFLNELKSDFPSAIPIKDRVKKEELIYN